MLKSFMRRCSGARNGRGWRGPCPRASAAGCGDAQEGLVLPECVAIGHVGLDQVEYLLFGHHADGPCLSARVGDVGQQVMRFDGAVRGSVAL
ncbi:hypothetical protein [Sagittula sp. S175]|uniref:hypothetical protein n=1 Tax=Sagittula sp. S175 TaxID=3415129 RepID=UPI003C7B0130